MGHYLAGVSMRSEYKSIHVYSRLSLQVIFIFCMYIFCFVYESHPWCKDITTSNSIPAPTTTIFYPPRQFPNLSHPTYLLWLLSHNKRTTFSSILKYLICMEINLYFIQPNTEPITFYFLLSSFNTLLCVPFIFNIVWNQAELRPNWATRRTQWRTLDSPYCVSLPLMYSYDIESPWILVFF